MNSTSWPNLQAITFHTEFYRLPEETVEVAKVSMLLLPSEQGKADLAGKGLDNIRVSTDEGKQTFCIDKQVN